VTAPVRGIADGDGHPRRWLVLAVLCLVLSVIVLDNTILTVAVPSLQRALDASEQDLQWITTAYALVLASLLLPLANLGDRRGRRGLVMIGLVVLGTACGASALADSPGVLIVTRGLMGLGGACALPGTLSIIGNVFPESERGRAIAIWSGSAGVSIALGPILGGLLLEHFWWGSVFLVNVPVVAAALVGVVLIVPPSRDPNPAPFDGRGSLLWTGALVGLLFGIIEAPERGWLSAAVLVAFAVGAGTFVAFLRVERAARAPLLDLGTLRTWNLRAGIVVIVASFFALFGAQFVVTQDLQLVQGLGPLATGFCFVPLAVASLVASLQNPRFVSRFGHRTAAAGLAIDGVGIVVTSLGTSIDSVAVVVIGMFLIGAGTNLAIPSGVEMIMQSVPPERAGAAAGINETLVEAGGAVGVAVLGTVIAAGATGHEPFSPDAVPWSLLVAALVAGVAALVVRRLVPAARAAVET
jgi:EmrB/QacA subfamily drug resistance transporter